ncbi:MAG: response regulator [Elusimicrobiota bacterium]
MINTPDKKKVLVVEDEPLIVALLSTALTARGYEVTIAEDGEKALELVSKILPDIILLDLMIPKISGYDVCKTIKADDQFKSIPVIAVSALAQQIEINRALTAGVQEYVIKPYKMSALLEIIRKYV